MCSFFHQFRFLCSDSCNFYRCSDYINF